MLNVRTSLGCAEGMALKDGFTDGPDEGSLVNVFGGLSGIAVGSFVGVGEGLALKDGGLDGLIDRTALPVGPALGILDGP